MKPISEKKHTSIFSKTDTTHLVQRGANLGQTSKQIEGDAHLADVVLYNERLLLVIERFGIPLGFGDKTIAEICSYYELNTSLVLMVMNIFVNPSSHTKEELTEEMLPEFIDYLKRGHRYYLDEKLPYISELIDRFIEHTDNPDTKLLQAFFKGYAREVNEHMQLEDATVFPYIQALHHLLKEMPYNKRLLQYSMDDFVKHHSDIEEKLEDLTQLLIKHFPPTKDRFYRNTILFELFALHYDLNDHGRIEEQILVPLVRQLEKRKAKDAE